MHKVVLGLICVAELCACKSRSAPVDAPPTVVSVSVGGSVTGLSGTVVLQNNARDNLTLTQNGPFEFATPVDEGESYAVTVLTQPSNPTQACVVANAAGTIARQDIRSIMVNCTTSSFKIGGSVTGLDGTGLRLGLAGQELAVTADGPFEFPGALASGTPFEVTVLQQPTGNTQTCVVAGNGTVGGANVGSVVVSCANDRFMVGGTITGLAGTLVLQNNLADDLTINTAGTSTFAFLTTVASGSAYAVSIKTQPANRICELSNESGTVTTAHVTDIGVACRPTQHTVGGTFSSFCSQTVFNNGGDAISFPQSNGTVVPFTFSTPLAEGASYNVTVTSGSNPAVCECSVTNASGIVSTMDVTNVAISCRLPADASPDA